MSQDLQELPPSGVPRQTTSQAWALHSPVWRSVRKRRKTADDGRLGRRRAGKTLERMWAPLLNGPGLPFASVWASAGVAVVVQLWLIIVGAAAALVVAAIAAWAASYPAWQAPEQKEEHRGEEPLEPANHFLALPDDVLALALSQPLFRATDMRYPGAAAR
eukprot:scaffold103210_cov61-Phaeocystis_antarctica.AAC.1